MSRSKWKGPYVNSNYLKSFSKSKKNYVHEMSRNSEIIPQFLGLTFNIHNGKTFVELTVSDSMIGHKFGEFVFTRARFSFKKKGK